MTHQNVIETIIRRTPKLADIHLIPVIGPRCKPWRRALTGMVLGRKIPALTDPTLTDPHDILDAMNAPFSAQERRSLGS